MTGSLQKKGNKYYVVINYKDFNKRLKTNGYQQELIVQETISEKPENQWKKYWSKI